MIGSSISVGYSLIAAVSGYALTSFLLLYFPELLHKKKKQHFRCAHISHRGGAVENIENTLMAYHHAVEAGTQMLELDVHMSKDKQVVVCHDGDLSRITDGKGCVSDYDHSELPPLKKTISVTFYKSVSCQYEGEELRMPTLEDVFKQFPNVPINLDIKAENTELMEKCQSLIERYQREKITVWGSHRNSTVVQLYNMNPDIPLFFSVRRVLLVYFWFYIGLLPFMPLKESYFEVVLPDISKHTKFSTQRKIFFWWFGWLLKSKLLIAHLKKRGIPTYYWVLNEEKDFQTAFKLGAEGVMTDCPTKLTKWLDAHPQYWV